MKKITARMVHGDARPEDGALLKSVADQIALKLVGPDGYVLTEAGFTRLKAAYPAHLASVRCRVLDHIRAEEIPGIFGPLQRIANALEASSGTPSRDQT